MEQTGSPATARDTAADVPEAPLPPPPPPPVATRRERSPASFDEPGQLTVGWRIATAIVWGLVFVGYTAVWKTSRELGLNTWWLGPIGDPAGWWLSMLPFLAPLAMILLAVNNAKGLPWFGLGATAWCTVIALFDLGPVFRLALVELAIAAAGALAAIGSISGLLRERS